MKQSTTIDQGSVKTSALNQVLPAFFLMTALTALYFLSLFITPGWFTTALSALSLIVIVITALARVNDITAALTGARWHIRRFGLVLTGVGAAAVLVMPIVQGVHPTWREVMLEFGVALTWFTTPGMPPWWKFIAGKSE